MTYSITIIKEPYFNLGTDELIFEIGAIKLKNKSRSINPDLSLSAIDTTIFQFWKLI
jgi:hypothetical protein